MGKDILTWKDYKETSTDGFTNVNKLRSMNSVYGSETPVSVALREVEDMEKEKPRTSKDSFELL